MASPPSPSWPYGSGSGSYRDDDLDEDIEALRRACMPTGADLDDVAAVAESDSNSAGDSCGNDDMGLLRRLQERFSAPSSAVDIEQNLPMVEPKTTRPPPVSDGEEDDFETLRAIQRRFSQYQAVSGAAISKLGIRVERQLLLKNCRLGKGFVLVPPPAPFTIVFLWVEVSVGKTLKKPAYNLEDSLFLVSEDA